MSLRLSHNSAGSSPLSLPQSNSHETNILCNEDSVDSIPTCPVGMIVGLMWPSCVRMRLLLSSLFLTGARCLS